MSEDGGAVNLDSATRLEMRAQPSHDIGGHEQQSGFWLELRDANDRVLYRRTLHNPFPQDAEVFPETSGEDFSRTAIPRQSGSIDVVVPDLPDARSVAVFGNLPGPPQTGEPAAVHLARITAARQAPARLIGLFALPTAEDR
jgi:hypothetical protein